MSSFRILASLLIFASLARNSLSGCPVSRQDAKIRKDADRAIRLRRPIAPPIAPSDCSCASPALKFPGNRRGSQSLNARKEGLLKMLIHRASMKYQRFVLGLALLGVAAWPVWSQNKDDFFEARVRPILAAECFSCHTDSQSGGLRLDSREAMLRGGQSGPAIVPGDPEKSLIVIAVRQAGSLKMPKGGRLMPDQIEAIAQWIRSGAFWPVTGKTLVAA